LPGRGFQASPYTHLGTAFFFGSPPTVDFPPFLNGYARPIFLKTPRFVPLFRQVVNYFFWFSPRCRFPSTQPVRLLPRLHHLVAVFQFPPFIPRGWPLRGFAVCVGCNGPLASPFHFVYLGLHLHFFPLLTKFGFLRVFPFFEAISPYPPVGFLKFHFHTFGQH